MKLNLLQRCYLNVGALASSLLAAPPELNMEHAAKCMERRMRNLADREHTDVLEYAYDSQDRGADAVMCVKMFEIISDKRRTLGDTMTNKDAGRALCTKEENIRDFAKNFPGIFKNAVDLEGAPRHFAMLKQLARIRQEVEKKEMSEAEANVHATRVILEKTMRAPTEKERAESLTQTVDAAPAPGS